MSTWVWIMLSMGLVAIYFWVAGIFFKIVIDDGKRVMPSLFVSFMWPICFLLDWWHGKV